MAAIITVGTMEPWVVSHCSLANLTMSASKSVVRNQINVMFEPDEAMS